MRKATLLLFLLSAPAWGQLKITGEAKVKANRMVRLTATGMAEGAALVWDVSDEDRCDVEESGNRLLLVAPPGTYKVKVRALTVKDGKTAAETARVTVVVEAEQPPVPPPPPKKAADPVQATCKLRFGNSGCTATVVAPRRADGRWEALTASHCTGEVGSKGRITLKDGRSFTVTVVARNRSADLSWLVTDEAPEDMPHALLATSNPTAGVKVWHQGYGVDRPGNRESGNVQGGPSATGQLAFKLSVSSGDSGGGIFREDTGELVAAVCCTTGMGRQVTMFGGSCTTAIAMRPKSEDLTLELPARMPDPPAWLLLPYPDFFF